MRLRDVPDPLLATALVLGIALVATRPATAGDSFTEKIEGVYEATASQSAARERIDKQIEKVVQKMAFYKRPFARSQLRDATRPCEEMAVEVDDDRVSLTCDDQPPAVAKPDGTETTYAEKDGTTHELSQTVGEDRIVQVFDSEDGMRTNTYRLRGDDTLVLSVKLESSQLPEPVTYSRTFERE